MSRIKRLYIYMLQTFLPLLFMTFGICLFIVLMQFLWRYIDDMVGKGLEIAILAEMLFYAALSLVPMALPLAILLASLMTFGNLGERLELLAIKAAGVSLIRTMRPLIVTIGFISVGAFFFQNNIMPIAQVKLYTLLYSMRQKSPELDIPEGVFCSDISGYNLYVKEKDNKTGLLKDIMIYDYKEGYNNANIIVADSGRLKTSADKLFLVLTLYNGESFKNLKPQSTSSRTKEAVPYQRESFAYRELLIEYDGNFERADDAFLQNNYLGKNIRDLQTSIDSMTLKLDSIKEMNSIGIYNASYKKLTQQNTKLKEEERTEEERIAEEPVEIIRKKSPTTLVLNFDSLYQKESPSGQVTLLTRAKSNADNVRSEYYFRASNLADDAYKLRRHETEWHSKFTLCFACLVFFFIGAPLGAIIRKGGLGLPVVISVILFIFYYIVNNIGFKMARDGVWEAWEGMWLSSAVLAPLGIFLTYKAVNDSVILNADTYLNALKNLIGKRSGRKIERKEVIIFAPDYPALLPRLQALQEESAAYLATNRRWLNYVTYWKQGGNDYTADKIGEEMESIVEELNNSDQILVLNKLMDYPIIAGHNQFKTKFNTNINLAIGLFIPVGIPVYLLATYQRKLLRTDILAIQKTSQELYELINSL